MALQEVVRYPSQLLQSSSQQYCGPPLPSLILPTSSCHLKLGGCSPPPGRQISVLGVPPGLPAALVFADSLSRTSCECVRRALGGSEPLEEHHRALCTCLSSLSALLIQVDFPPVLKEKLFQCVSGILWTIHSLSSSSSSLPVLPSELLRGLHQELQKLYEHECGGFASDHNSKSKLPPRPSPGPPTGRVAGKFSTYLQSLLELVVAAEQCCDQSRDTQTPSPLPSQESADGNGRRKKSKTAKKRDWLVYVKRAVSLLIRLHGRCPLPRGFFNCFLKSMPARPQSRLLVVTGISPSVEPTTARQRILQLCNQHGGLPSDGLFLPTCVSSVEGKSNQRVLVGGAVVELCSAEKCELVSNSLLSCSELQGEQKELSVFTVSDSLLAGEEEGGPPKNLLDEFLRAKLLREDSLAPEARTVLSRLFCSAAGEGRVMMREEVEGEGVLGDNTLHLFLRGVCGGGSYQELLDWVWRGRKELPLDGFLVRAEQQSMKNPCSVWLGLFAAGYDLHFERYDDWGSPECWIQSTPSLCQVWVHSCRGGQVPALI